MNLARNSHCIITTGTNTLDGLDVVVEGEAVLVTDEARLRRLADAYVAKYDQLFARGWRSGLGRAVDCREISHLGVCSSWALHRRRHLLADHDTGSPLD